MNTKPKNYPNTDGERRMKLRTSQDITGFAPKASTWTAVDDDTYDGPGSAIGSGATETDAVLDLMGQLKPADQFDVWRNPRAVREAWTYERLDGQGVGEGYPSRLSAIAAGEASLQRHPFRPNRAAEFCMRFKRCAE